MDLAYTDIESIPLDAFRGLINLREIELSGNKFVTVPASLAAVGRTLEYLTFNNNPIVELNDDSFFGKCKKNYCNIKNTISINRYWMLLIINFLRVNN